MVASPETTTQHKSAATAVLEAPNLGTINQARHGVSGLAESMGSAQNQKLYDSAALKEANVSAQNHSVHASFDPRPVIATVAMWEDVMGTRRAIQQRLLAIEKAGVDPPADMEAIFFHLEEAEKRCKLLIRREWRKHPLAEWAKSIHGLGEHSIAVVVAYLDGDPCTAWPRRWDGDEVVSDPPYRRTVGQLRAYCGYGDPARKRSKGMSQEETLALGKPLLKARLRLIAESFLKSQSPDYVHYYYEAKDRYTDRDWTDLHKHNAALRFMVKAFLKDLWLAAQYERAPHLLPGGQS